MSKLTRQVLFLFPTACLLLGLVACFPKEKKKHILEARDWKEILASDTLRIGTITSPAIFFMYRGESQGYEYQKVLAFSKHYSLFPSIQLTSSIDTLYKWVANGTIDVCITPIAMTTQHLQEFTCCGPTNTSALVLVQHISKTPIRSVLEMHQHRIHVLQGSAEQQRMQQIDQEMGHHKEFQLVELDNIGVEEMLDSIKKDPDFLAIAEERLANVYKKYNPELDIKTRISVPLRYSWIANKTNTELGDSLTSFFKHHEEEFSLHDAYSLLYWNKNIGEVSTTWATGTISPYDKIFQDAASRFPWDWTLLAAIAFQESRFRPSVVGWSGAVGLMGIMPSTGKAFGANKQDLMNPNIAVRIATDYLRHYSQYFEHIPDSTDKIRFTLASYNAGIGHIQDACRLAKKLGLPSTSWNNAVEKCVLLKSNPKYYNDPVCKFGYMRGKETVNYVRNVIQKSNEYKNLLRNSPH